MDTNIVNWRETNPAERRHFVAGTDGNYDIDTRIAGLFTLL